MSILKKINNLLIIILISTSTNVQAQDEADELFGAGDWTAAADAYARITADDPENATAWFRLAVSARGAARPDEARDALAQAEALQFSPLRIGLERARLDVLADDSGSAMTELKAIADRGFTAVNVIAGDPVLGTLAGNPDYDALIVELSRRAYPCEHDAAFSAFDFWVGEWDVHVSSGSFAGSNRIEKAERGCLMLEYWRSASGGTGSSINYLDKITGEWVQVWNDASGNQINIRGGMTPEGMRLTGTIHYVANGNTAAFRGLWTPLEDGRVRQFFEQQSADNGAWSTWFEGFYTKKSASQADTRIPN